MGMNKYLNFEIHPIVTETLKRYPRLWEVSGRNALGYFH